MAGCISLRGLAPGPAPATYGVLGGDHADSVSVHSSPWRRDALYRFVWLGDNFCPDAKRFDRVDRQGARVSRAEDSHTAGFCHSCCGGRVLSFHALGKSAIWQDPRAAQFRAEVASRHSGIRLVKPASISRQLDFVEMRNAFLPKRILSSVRRIA